MSVKYNFSSIDDKLKTVAKENAVVLSREKVDEAGDKMIELLRNFAWDADLPPSVYAHFNSLFVSSLVFDSGAGSATMKISFRDDLSRPSLICVRGKNRGEPTGEGIDDIVMLYETGIEKDDVSPVYGYYESWGSLKTSSSGEFGKNENSFGSVIKSRTVLEGSHFLTNAVDAFNMSYGATYGAEAQLG